MTSAETIYFAKTKYNTQTLWYGQHLCYCIYYTVHGFYFFQIRPRVGWITRCVNISKIKTRGKVAKVLNVCSNICSVRRQVEVVMFSITVNNIVGMEKLLIVT